MDYTIKNLRDVEDVAAGQGFGEFQEARFAHGDLDAEQVGISLQRVKPGKRHAFAHRHNEVEEIYVVVAGSGGVKLDDEVKEIIDCFEADWHRKKFDVGGQPRLIWCNYNGRERIAEFIDRAKDTLFVQNERYQDAVIIERLVRAARRGVKIHVMTRAPHTLKKEKLVEGVGGIRILDDVGVKVHKLKHLKLHAKMLLADEKRAIVGSINLTPGSFDSRRELAIELDDKHLVKRLHHIARHDWKHSHPLDLTDEGLIADLEKRGREEVDKLALSVGKHKSKEKRV